MRSCRRLSAITILILVSSFVYGQNGFSRLKYPNVPHEIINDIYFTNVNDGIMVTDGGGICKTIDGGRKWRTLDYLTFENLNTIHFVNKQKGWVAGARGTMFATGNAGYNWAPISFPEQTDIRCIWFCNADTGFAVIDTAIYRTTNGGTGWTKTSVRAGNYYPRLNYVEFFGKDTGYAFSYSRIISTGQPIMYRTTDGGNNWKADTLMKPFYKMDFANKNIGWAISDSNDFDIYYKTTDGGKTWAFQYRVYNYSKKLNSVYHTDMHVLDTSNVFILDDGTGSGNTRLYYTNNGGASWLNNDFSPFTWTTAVFFTTPQRGHVGFLWGDVSSTWDGGTTWSYRNMEQWMLSDIFFRNNNYGWALNVKGFLRTKDGGRTWKPTTGSIPGNSWFKQYCFPDTLKGWATTDDAHVYRSVNGGETWSLKASSFFATDVEFYDTSFGMVSRADGKIAITRNAGNSWSYANLGAGRNISKIKMTDSLHWLAQGTGSSGDEFYKTVDAGANWTIHTSPAGSDDYVVPDTLSAYNVNSSAYKSVDGGRTWSGTTLPPDKQLFKVKMSAYDSSHIIASQAHIYGLGSRSDNFIISNNAGKDWNTFRINASYPGSGMHYIDSNNLWIVTAFGSIFHYDPAYVSDGKYAPFFDRDMVIACPSSTVTVKIDNYATYSTVDTLKLLLKLGSTTVQTLSANSSGVVSFTAPSTTGNYILEARLSNPNHPKGELSTLPVYVQSAVAPYFGYWRGVSDPQCIKDGAVVGLSSTNIGRDATYELHMLMKNGKDSLLNTNWPFTIVNGVTDSFRLYYKVDPGMGCWTTPLYNSDTLSVNVIGLQKPSAHVITDRKANTTCWGDSIRVKLQGKDWGTSPACTYYKLSLNGTVTKLLSVYDSSYKIDALTDTACYFARILPSADACAPLDSFSSDTVKVFPVPITIVKATISSNRPNHTICKGDTITFTVSTTTVLDKEVYEFYKDSSGWTRFLQSDTLNSYSSSTLTDKDTMYCRVYPSQLNPCIAADIITDSIVVTIELVPSAPTITIASDSLIANTIQGAIYTWYKDGVEIPGAVGPLYIAGSDKGVYTVKVKLGNCTSPLSAAANYDPTDIDGHAIANRFKIYPNPARHELHINANSTPYDVVIKDIHARIVYEAQHITTPDMIIIISEWAQGVYTITLNDEQGIGHTTFVKQ